MSLEAPRSRAQSGHDLIEQALTRLPEARRPPIRRFGFGREINGSFRSRQHPEPYSR